MKVLNKKEKKEFIDFIKSNFGETHTYDQDHYPLYFDDIGDMLHYNLDEGYEVFLKINKKINEEINIIRKNR